MKDEGKKEIYSQYIMCVYNPKRLTYHTIIGHSNGASRVEIIAATKEACPDLDVIHFSEEVDWISGDISKKVVVYIDLKI